MSFLPARCPIRITPKALEIIQSSIQQMGIDTGLYGLRVGIRGGGCGASPLLGFDTAQPADERYALENFLVFVEKNTSCTYSTLRLTTRKTKAQPVLCSTARTDKRPAKTKSPASGVE